jgi:multiple sugar transport system ATP-binding protein
MAQIALDHVDKVYRGGLKALDDLNLAVADGEFMVLLGPAGCGKSTALRSIAGLEEINGGTISIGQEVANHLPPRDRDVAMVSPSHALYPRLTVEQNLAFGLRLRGAPKAEVGRRVARAARMLGLEQYLPRHPATLSAGLRQRVAMGRAIVREPRAFLMDEPLSNLDAGLRASMRAVLGQVRERLGVTTVYVTHDQAEAMALGDRVCVLLDGRSQQADTPRRLFESPANLFVAGYIGFPAMNFAEARLVRDDGPTVTFAGHALPVPAAVLESRPGLADYLGRTVIVGIRPSHFGDASHGGAARGDASWARLPVTVTATAELGPQTHAIFSIDAPPIDHSWFVGAAARSAEEDEAVSALAGGKSLWTARVSARSARPGQPLELAVDTGKLHFFDPTTGESIGHLSARHEFAVSPLSSNPGQRHGDLREGRQWLIIWRSSRSSTQTRTSSGPTSRPSRPGSPPPRRSCTTCPPPTSTPPTGGCRPPRSRSAAGPAAPTPAGTSSSRPAGRCPTTLPSRTACPPAARCTSHSSAVVPTARVRRSSPCASRREWLRSPAASPSRPLQPFAPNGPS